MEPSSARSCRTIVIAAHPWAIGSFSAFPPALLYERLRILISLSLNRFFSLWALAALCFVLCLFCLFCLLSGSSRRTRSWNLTRNRRLKAFLALSTCTVPYPRTSIYSLQYSTSPPFIISPNNHRISLFDPGPRSSWTLTRSQFPQSGNRSTLTYICFRCPSRVRGNTSIDDRSFDHATKDLSLASCVTAEKPRRIRHNSVAVPCPEF